MNQYAITAEGLPTLKVLAHSVTGALSKARAVNVKLFGEKATDLDMTFRLLKRNVR